MSAAWVRRCWHVFADWWSFQMGTVEGWFDRTPESRTDRAIREEGERLRKAFPWIDFDQPGARGSARQIALFNLHGWSEVCP
jgi:hypothetical protein